MIYQVEGWRPLQASMRELSQIEIGSLVAFDYKPYRLIEVRERAFDLWPENIRAEFERMGATDPETWWARVQTIRLQPDGQSSGRGDLQRLVRACYSLDVLPEHYAVCHRCGDLPPCREIAMDRQVAEATALMDHAMTLEPNDCHACGKPVTGRHKAISFPGPNLIRPDLPDGSAVFHAKKGDCFTAAYRYDEKWAAAEEGRRRRCQCGGRQIRHADGTLDCTEGVACPEAAGPADWTVHHKSFTWHRRGVWTGDGDCWCTAASVTGRIEQQMRDGQSS